MTYIPQRPWCKKDWRSHRLYLYTEREYSRHAQWNHHVASLIHARHSWILFCMIWTFPPFSFINNRCHSLGSIQFVVSSLFPPVTGRYSAIFKIWKRSPGQRSKWEIRLSCMQLTLEEKGTAKYVTKSREKRIGVRTPRGFTPLKIRSDATGGEPENAKDKAAVTRCWPTRILLSSIWSELTMPATRKC